MLGQLIDGYRVLAAGYKKLDPAQPVVVLLGDTTMERNYEFAVAQLTPDGKQVDGEITGLTDDEQAAWEEFGDRSA